MKYCPDCRLDYPDTSKFCKACGKSLVLKPAQSESCPSCGSAMQSGWKFCKECGHSFSGAGASHEQTAPVSQTPPAVTVAAPTEFSITCVACGFAQAPGEPFCKGCGRPFSQPTEPRADSATLPAYSPSPSYSGPSAPFVPEVKVEPPPPPPPVTCATCGHQNRPDAEQCEACGALVGIGLKRKRRRRILVGVLASLISLIVLVCGLGVGWYFWGVTVTVSTDPADARVFIDDKEVGKSKDAGAGSLSHIRAGEHSLKVIRDGYDEWKQSFTIELTDFNKSLNAKLNATKFKLTVVSTPPGSEVLVDDVSVGRTSETSGSFSTEPMKLGEHSLIVRHDGYHDWKQTVSLKADMKVEVTLSSAPIIDTNTGSAETDIRNTLEGWAQTTRNRDLDAHMRYYADTLDYYYKLTLVPSVRVREDRSKAFARFNTLTNVTLNNMTVQLDSTNERATVILDKNFDFKGDNNAFYNGSVQVQLTMTKLAGAWLITGEKELKVYYVNK
jgi:ketosteroid isomerase-like protein/predicted nucleic acid-binding Zn ribbon protein